VVGLADVGKRAVQLPDRTRRVMLDSRLER
jgi:hypothetical protein